MLPMRMYHYRVFHVHRVRQNSCARELWRLYIRRDHGALLPTGELLLDVLYRLQLLPDDRAQKSRVSAAREVVPRFLMGTSSRPRHHHWRDRVLRRSRRRFWRPPMLDHQRSLPLPLLLHPRSRHHLIQRYPLLLHRS